MREPTPTNGQPSLQEHHVVSWRIYLVIFGALLVLTVLTVVAAGIDFGALNTLIAMAIAVTKATLVVLFFMHVKYSNKLTALMLSTALLMLALLILFTFSDYFSRPWPIAG
jgi:cytochrome c oxidase subunit 4